MAADCKHPKQVKIVLESVVTIEKTVIICAVCKKWLSEPVIET
ncbi:hypothetical protein SAMN05421741_11837 [Paenimyroides ummariense]|uniref:Uncharacterized protein n=1 Tax=Paenimyroides ummariense TaxID=913024 RepID=A0A1I5E0Z1_9FLAO|nr:hypothetical protein SAMN05421741_11837 [Paenimyroides ummariense]